MCNYDFEILQYNEFENLTRDLLQKEFDIFVESFKDGKDGGIDLRFGINEKMKCIVQVKRYKNWSFLKTQLEKEVKKDRSLREPEEYMSYLLVRLLNDERYSDVHETILNLSKDIEVLRFLCAPEGYEIGAIKAHWLRYVTNEQLKKLLVHKTIRKKIILYSEKKKWDNSLLDKMHQFDKE